jgi:cathepsin B
MGLLFKAHIQKEIISQGPVQAIFRVYSDFFMYKIGVYEPFIKNKDDPIAYHSVKLLGWGIENEVPYWVKSLFKFIYIK